MKITILSTAYPYRGGIAQLNSLLYRELSKNHEVNVLTFSRQYPTILFPGKSQLEEKESGDIIPTELAVDSINPFNWKKTGKRVKEEAPDLLIFRYWMPFFAPCFGVIAEEVKKNNKTRILVIVDNAIPHEKMPFGNMLSRYFFKKADYFITMSKSVEKDLYYLMPHSKQKLLYHPVYSSFGDKVPKQEAKERLGITEKKILLFFGFIRDYKGLDTLLRSMSILKDKIDLTLLVAGEFYSNEDKYQKLIDELDIRNNLLLYNIFIHSSEVRYFFSASDVVVLPYKDATQSGITAIAKHFNKPVIATRVGGLTEIISEGKNGYLVEPDNPEKLAEAILNYYERNNEEEFSENIKKELEMFSLKRYTEEILNFVNN